MIFDAILTLISVFICAITALFISRTLLGDDNESRVIRGLASIICFFILMGIARLGLNSVFNSVNIEKELATDPMFQALKLKHPNKFQTIVSEIELIEKTNGLNKEDVIMLSQQQMAPIISDIVSNAGDDSRHKFVNAAIKNIRILKDQDETACYDSMFRPKAMANKMQLATESFYDSGMNTAMIAAINDSGIDKSAASEKTMQATAQKAFQYLGRKYGQDTMLVMNPQQAVTVEDKRKVCDILIDFYTYLNVPKDKAKMATLRKTLEEAGNIM